MIGNRSVDLVELVPVESAHATRRLFQKPIRRAQKFRFAERSVRLRNAEGEYIEVFARERRLVAPVVSFRIGSGDAIPYLDLANTPRSQFERRVRRAKLDVLRLFGRRLGYGRGGFENRLRRVDVFGVGRRFFELFKRRTLVFNVDRRFNKSKLFRFRRLNRRDVVNVCSVLD